MKTIFALAGMAGAIGAALPASAAERNYSITDFEEVRVIGTHDVVISTGRATTVTANGSAAAIDRLSVSTIGKTLTIRWLTPSRSTWQAPSDGGAKVFVTLPQLKAVRVEGSAVVRASELSGLDARLSLAGAGRIEVARLASDRASVRMLGSGRIQVAGEVKTLDADIRGSADLDGSQLTVSDIKLVSATSGRIEMKGLRSANIKQTGVGEVIVSGADVSCTVENAGSGIVDCGR